MSDIHLDETDGLPMALSSPTSLAVGIARAEIDQQISTARAFPRSIKQVHDRIFSLATLDKESAEESMYALPRGGKPITGPSIRFAEIVKQAYGNCRAAARVVHVDRDEKYVEAEGVFHDLEANVATTARVRRRIVDSKGRLYSDDMIIVTGNAACSIALRNAIMGAVPKPLWRKAYEAVQGTIKGDVTTLSENRAKALQAFAVYGVKPEQVFAALDVPGLEDVTVEHIPLLRSMFATLKNGEATVEEMFSSRTAPETAPPPVHSGFSDEAGKAPRKKAAARTEKATAEDAPPNGPDQVVSDALDHPASDDETVTIGHASPGETYLMANDPFVDGRRLTYRDGERFSSVGPAGAKKLNIYGEHAPTIKEEVHSEVDDDDSLGEPEPETVKDDEPSDGEDMPAEFAAYISTIEKTTSFDEVKAALKNLQATEFWKGLNEAQTNEVRRSTWEAMAENMGDALPDPGTSISAYRLWIESQKSIEEIEAGLSRLEDCEMFQAASVGVQEGLRASTAARIAVLSDR